MANKKVTYDDTRDIAIRTVVKLIQLGLLEDFDLRDDENELLFEVQDTIHDNINEVLGLDINDNFEVEINGQFKICIRIL